ncbi:hypothetical protein E6O75_ATG05065 [Venturia nashicola]|uniref:Uncharacterized protein n=1 Tax=Venturia nashicola TaxID=86259 RepID=A0A4Z1P1Q3_9PEZI|nr:hypothetical protein E6O75_ATG05065 [Venturia nashicola]
MHFAKTIFVAILGLNSFVLAAPVEGANAADASVAVNAAPADLFTIAIVVTDVRETDEKERRTRIASAANSEAMKSGHGQFN